MRLLDDDGDKLAGMSADDIADSRGERRVYVVERTGMHLLEVWSEWLSGDPARFGYSLEFAEAATD